MITRTAPEAATTMMQVHKKADLGTRDNTAYFSNWTSFSTGSLNLTTHLSLSPWWSCWICGWFLFLDAHYFFPNDGWSPTKHDQYAQSYKGHPRHVVPIDGLSSIRFSKGREGSYGKHLINFKVLSHIYKKDQEEFDYQDCSGGCDNDDASSLRSWSGHEG